MSLEIRRNPEAATVITEGRIRNLYFEPLPFVPGTEIQIGGKRHELVMLAMQGYNIEGGRVMPHLEKKGVIEMYFVLAGEVRVYCETLDLLYNPVAHIMRTAVLQGAYSQKDLEGAKMRLLQGKNPLLTVEVNGEKRVIYPTFLPSGLVHATSSTPDSEGSRFLALKAMLL